MAIRDDVLNAALGVLSSRSAVGQDEIRTIVTRMAEAFGGSGGSDSLVDDLCRELESRLIVRMGSHVEVLDDHGHSPWLAATAAQRDDFYWLRYRDHLLRQVGLPSPVVSRLNETTDKILDMLQNPEIPGDWSRRGMVVGHVQSGKTANYTGLVCKAADAGYRLIIIIAGIHNNLRSQTQQRIEEGFIGQTAAEGGGRELVGVGLADRNNRRSPVSLTSRGSDFRKAVASQIALQLGQVKEPVVLVIKKNPSTLKHLIEWLERNNTFGGSAVSDHPMLLIDDEADNASINTSKDPQRATRINGLIRSLLKLFRKNSYVGYTATPFANIFIDPDTDTDMEGEDLFPRHFIIALRAPDNYIGGQAVFGDETPEGLERMLQTADDYEQFLPLKHKKEHIVEALPPSLEDALRVFLLARALRMLRGNATAHCTMMVNVSRFVAVQGEVRARIDDWMVAVKRAVRYNSRLPRSEALRNPELRALHDTYLDQFGHLEFDWNDVQAVLHDAVAPVHVVEVNQQNRSSLDYEANKEAGLHVIAVGGLSLSRGLTLEGLLVSYFLRNSQTYDTLMQMGRWFGYRPGYADLCRIYMPSESVDWYRHITEATQELHSEFRIMQENRQTPKDFGLKVRQHPDSLLVTARNKMHSADTIVRTLSLQNKLVEAYRLDEDRSEHNRGILSDFVAKLRGDLGEPEETDSRNWLWRDVAAEEISGFIEAFDSVVHMPRADWRLITDYIRKIAGNGIRSWDVVLVNRTDDQAPVYIEGIQVGRQERSGKPVGEPHPSVFDVTSRSRVASRGLEREGLSAEQRQLAEQLAHEDGKVNVADRHYRSQRKRPLLMLHVLQVRLGGSEVGAPWVASWGASFPAADDPQRDGVSYSVNRIYMQQLRHQLEMDLSELDGDEPEEDADE